jgi:hypothetical protein
MGIDDLMHPPVSVGWLVITAICILFSLNTVNRSNVHSLGRFWFNLKLKLRTRTLAPLSVEPRTIEQTNESTESSLFLYVIVCIW